MAQYGKTEYWEERYSRDQEPFDWYQRYSALRNLLGQQISKDFNILMAGCGNSRLSEEMHEDGYSTIVNVDISRTVIDFMSARCKDKSGMSFAVMNVTALSHGNGTFNAVVDKGTLDSLLCGDNATAAVAKYCAEVCRVLKPGGKFVIVSYGPPEHRTPTLATDDYNWTVTNMTIPKPTIDPKTGAVGEDPAQVHYIYVCTKSMG